MPTLPYKTNNDDDQLHTDLEMTPVSSDASSPDNNNIASSLPTLDDYNRTSGSPDIPRRCRRRLLAAAIATLLVLTIVGATLGTTLPRKNRGNTTSSSTESNTSAVKPYSLQELHTFLVDQNAASLAALQSPGAPAQLAALWLYESDRFVDSFTLSSQSELVSRYALVVLYYAWGGVTWEVPLNFLHPDQSICEWHALSTGFNDQTQLVEPEFGGVFCHDEDNGDAGRVGQVAALDLGAYRHLQSVLCLLACSGI